MNTNDKLMVLSGFLGFSFFLIANFTDIFLGLNVISGLIQIALNVFVFITWFKGFQTSTGFKKFISFWGVIIPVLMAGITIINVIIPTFI